MHKKKRQTRGKNGKRVGSFRLAFSKNKKAFILDHEVVSRLKNEIINLFAWFNYFFAMFDISV